MPYSFTQIEKSKTTLIGWLFVVLFLNYSFFAVLIYYVAKVAIFVALLFESERLASFFSFSFSLSPVEVGVALIFGLVGGVIHWLAINNDMIGKILRTLGARSLDPAVPSEQILADILAEVSIAGGAKNPIEGVVIPSNALNAFALADFDDRQVIGVTSGLLGKLSRAQLEAVIGHEAAHIFSQDCLLSTLSATLFGFFAAVNEFSHDMTENLVEDYGYGARLRLPLSAAFVAFCVSTVAFYAKGINRLMAMFISRQKELRADATAVRLTRDPLSLAEALYVISLNRNYVPRANSFESIFIVSPTKFWLDEETGFWANLFSTHPPLEQRLQILLDMAHVDIDVLIRKFRNKDREEVASGKDGSSTGPIHWLVYGPGGWQGPLNLLQIANLMTLRPDMCVMRVGSNDIVRVVDDPVLKGALSHQSKRAQSNFSCPRCHVPLRSFLYEAVLILSCPQCAGILGEEKDIAAIVAREMTCFTSQVKEDAEKLLAERPAATGDPGDTQRPDGLVCPQCQHINARMVRRFYDRQHPVEIDKCLFCGKVWFDHRELEVLQYLVDGEKNKSRHAKP